MEEYSEQDLRYAAELRNLIHKEALAIVKKEFPNADQVIDKYSVEEYFQQSWEYPGKWYTVVAIPESSRSRENLINIIVTDTLDYYRNR